MRAVRITHANWLNDEIGGDAGTVKLVRDEMAYDAVEVHHIAEYAPEYDQPGPSWSAGAVEQEPVVTEFPAAEPAFVGPEAAAARMDALQEMVTDTEQAGLYDPDPEPFVPGLDDDARKAPWSTASKADWIDWAVHQGCSPKQAALLTKIQLMSRYGERL